MSQERLTRQALLATPTGKRPRIRQRTRWSDYISDLAWSCLDAELGFPDHWKNFQGHFVCFVTIEILLHTYFEYFLDIVVQHTVSNKHY